MIGDATRGSSAGIGVSPSPGIAETGVQAASWIERVEESRLNGSCPGVDAPWRLRPAMMNDPDSDLGDAGLRVLFDARDDVGGIDRPSVLEVSEPDLAVMVGHVEVARAQRLDLGGDVVRVTLEAQPCSTSVPEKRRWAVHAGADCSEFGCTHVGHDEPAQ